MRLTEVAQPPTHQRDNADEGGALEHVEVPCVLQLNGSKRCIKAASGDQHDYWGQNQGKDHQGRLNSIGPAHSQEATYEGVGNGCRRTGPQGGFVGHAEGTFKQTGTGNNAGGAINGEEHQDHNGGDNPQQPALVFEAAGEVIRQGQGIAVVLSLHTQTAGNEQPVQVGTDDQTDGDPAFRQARHIDGTRQAHQQPAAHVRGTGRQCGYNATEATAAEDVVRKVVGGAIGHEADQHHCRDIDHECDQGWIAYTHCCALAFVFM
ncbi:hypothetical protein D3C79_649550 [compost metagenome]